MCLCHSSVWLDLENNPDSVRFTYNGKEVSYVATLHESRTISISEQIEQLGKGPGVYGYVTTGSFFLHYDNNGLDFSGVEFHQK